jgi:NAD dependent epimerase/dehydratase
LTQLNCIDDIEVLTGDVRDPHYCQKIAKGVDVIFHLAALIAIPYSYIAPDSYLDTNVKGTFNICQAARAADCERVIHTSTSEVYGTARYVPMDENHPLQPQSPYSASKVGADAVALSFYHAFDLPVIIARPFNTYGPRQSARAVIPTMITQVVSGKKEIRLGDLTPTRDFNYVTDTCRGLIALAGCDAALGEIVNIGSNLEISIGEVFNLIKELTRAEAEAVVDEVRVRPRVSEVYRLWCDNGKIRALTGYEPEYGLRAGLLETIAWFQDSGNLQKYRGDRYNV